MKQAASEHTVHLATKEDLAVLKADLYRALWLQGVGLIAAMGTVATFVRVV